MAQVTITIPDPLVPRVKAAMRATFPQHDELGDVAAFRAVTADYWRDILTRYEAAQAQDAAWQSVREQEAAAEADAAGIG